MNLKRLLTLTILTIPSFALAQSSDNEDRAYFDDHKNEKLILQLKDPKTDDITKYILVETETFEGKPRFVLGLVGDEKQQLLVTEASKSMTFTFETEEALARLIQDYLIAGNKASALREMRGDIYALLPLLQYKDTLFDVQENILEYMELLISAERTNEFYAIFKTLNLSNLREEYTILSLNLAKIFAQKGDFEKALDVLDTLKIELNNKELIPDLMEILTIFRDAKKIKEVSRYYLRLQAIDGNKDALEAKMWSLYCDIQLGNIVTASVLIEDFGKMDKKLPEYSLYRMIVGLIAKSNDKTELALENFSEGIVYGKSIDDWMPELMYNTSLSYKQTDKQDIAMQILEEMRKFYPENPFLVLAERDIK